LGLGLAESVSVVNIFAEAFPRLSVCLGI